LAALGEAGRRFVHMMLDESDSDVSLVQGLLLLEAAQVLDHATGWRAAASTDQRAARLALQHVKVFAALLAQLRVS
jgi:hypothetical protein